MSKFVLVEYTFYEEFTRNFVKDNIWVNIDHVITYHPSSSLLTLPGNIITLTDKSDKQILQALGDSNA